MVLLLSFLTTLLTPLGQPDSDRMLPDQDELEARVTLMYRRSGHTAKFYDHVSNGDTLHYYQRNENSFFRVYTFEFTTKIFARQVTVESYKGDTLLRKVEARVMRNGPRIEAVDTYLDSEEDLVKVSIGAGPSAFSIFIVPDI